MIERNLDKLKIIDLRAKGNVLRLVLGKKKLKGYYGDDWNDKPYQRNAGEVYSEFIECYLDLAFNFDTTILLPEVDMDLCKDDFVAHKAPCCLIIPKIFPNYYTFTYALEKREESQQDTSIIPIYYNDNPLDILSKAVKYNGFICSQIVPKEVD